MTSCIVHNQRANSQKLGRCTKFCAKKFGQIWKDAMPKTWFLSLETDIREHCLKEIKEIYPQNLYSAPLIHFILVLFGYPLIFAEFHTECWKWCMAKNLISNCPVLNIFGFRKSIAIRKCYVLFEILHFAFLSPD